MPYNLRKQTRIQKLALKHDGKFRPDINDYAGYFSVDDQHQVGVCEIRGRRYSQEDALAFDKNIKFNHLSKAQQKLVLELSFHKMQQQYAHVGNQGSTGCVVTTWQNEQKAQVVTANLGDSTAFLVVTDQQKKLITAKRLNKLHKPTDPEEAKRIIAAGGYVADNRLDGVLAISRAFGDISLKGISHTPDVTFIEENIDAAMKAFVIVACDGVDESLSEQQIFQIIANNSHLSPSEIANELVMQAYQAFSHDNISVMVVPISETCVSAAIFDGHGGSQVSSALGENFYRIFNQELSSVLEAKDKKKFNIFANPSATPEKAETARAHTSPRP